MKPRPKLNFLHYLAEVMKEHSDLQGNAISYSKATFVLSLYRVPRQFKHELFDAMELEGYIKRANKHRIELKVKDKYLI